MLALLVCGVPGAFGQEARKLHVIIAADTATPGATASREFDAYRVNEYFRYAVPPLRRGPTVLLSGGDLTKAALLQAIDGSCVDRRDSLLVYFTGGGTFIHGRHALELPNGDVVLRADVVASMKRRSPQLGVLLTETAAVGAEGPLASSVALLDYRPPYRNANICRYLFFRSAGFVDINACDEGEKALFQTPPKSNHVSDGMIEYHGGCFTSELISALTMDDEAARMADLCDDSGLVTWARVRQRISKGIDFRFQNLKPGLAAEGVELPAAQTSQSLAFDGEVRCVGHSLPSKSSNPLGASLKEGEEAKATIVEAVEAGSVGDWVGLAPGDTLLRIDRVESGFWKQTVWRQSDVPPIRGAALEIAKDFREAFSTDRSPAPGVQPAVTPGMWALEIRRAGGEKETLPVRIPDSTSD